MSRYHDPVPTAVRVLFPLPLPAFSYLVPFDRAVPAVGCRVVVPWQQGIRVGIVVEVEELSAAQALELRELIDSLETEPFLLPDRVTFIDALAAQTCSVPGRVLASLLPASLTEPLHHEVRRVDGAEGIDLPEGWLEAASVSAHKLDLYRRQGLLRERVRRVIPTMRVLKAVREVDSALEGKAKLPQREALEALWGFEWVASAAEFARDAGLSESTVRTLIKKG